MFSTLLIALPLLFSPGPAYLISFTLAARLGLSKIKVFILGIVTIYAAFSVLFGYLLAEISGQVAVVINIVQVIGGIFIFYLGICLIKRKEFGGTHLQKPGFLDGVVIQLLNTKYPAVVLIIFSSSPNEPTLVTAGVITIMSTCGLLIYSFAGSIVHSMMSSGKFLRVLDILFGIMLCLVGIWMLKPFLNHLFLLE